LASGSASSYGIEFRATDGGCGGRRLRSTRNHAWDAGVSATDLERAAHVPKISLDWMWAFGSYLYFPRGRVSLPLRYRFLPMRERAHGKLGVAEEFTLQVAAHYATRRARHVRGPTAATNTLRRRNPSDSEQCMAVDDLPPLHTTCGPAAGIGPKKRCDLSTPFY